MAIPPAQAAAQAVGSNGANAPSGNGNDTVEKQRQQHPDVSSIPRRRISYLIPPPPANQPPPYLSLPTGTAQELRALKRGNPNPLIILADPSKGRVLNGPRQSVGSPSALSSSLAASSSSSSQHYHAPGVTEQRHPEHTLGITAFALDTSTIIDNSSSPTHRKSPGGILYSGGRDGLVAAWELGLPFQKREREHGYVGSGSHTKQRYQPRWAEDSYDDDQPEEEDEPDLQSDNASSEDSSVEDQPFRQNTRNSAPYRQQRRRPSARDEDAEYEDNEAEESLLGGNDANAGFSGSPRSRQPNNSLLLDTSNRRSSTASRTPYKRFSFSSDTRTGPSKVHNFPYEDRWQLDKRKLEQQRSPSSVFRQAHRGHTDWVNDIVLCNLGQTVVSASSDRMIRAWNPHDPHRSLLPAALGSHHDYVKCLALARESSWVASGGFDRKIKIWDVMESRSDPIVEYCMNSSPYALASNASGSTIVAGSPEKVVKIYDPRAAQKNPIAGLVGHADNVRALVVSQDGRHVLSASSDSTVKMWSVSMRRCLFTFTHHSDSVWSLFSSHPHLEVFYSGDRAGAVCKVDFENAGDIASEGECAILFRNRDGSKPGSNPSVNDGINRIVALDDSYVWTASSSSNICRWKDIPRKSQRLSRPTTAAQNRTHSIPEQDEPSVSVPVSATAPIPISGALIEDTSNEADRSARTRPTGIVGQDRSPATQHTVSFSNLPTHRSSSQSASDPQAQPIHRPSSLRYGSASRISNILFSTTPPASNLSPIASSPRSLHLHSLRSPTMATAAMLNSFGEDDVPLLNNIPLESLVPLVPPNDPYAGSSGLGLAPGAGYSASVLSLHRSTSRGLQSGAANAPFGSTSLSTPPSSSLSAPRTSRVFNARTTSAMPPLHHTASSASYRPSSATEEPEDTFELSPIARGPQVEAFMVAQQEYEDRESALDGMPLRQSPDEVIRGRSGLVKAEVLNDRRTVISLDTLGEIAVWDIVLAACIGRFAKTEFKKRPVSLHSVASLGSEDTTDSDNVDAADLLSFVRQQIEGEATVQPWCLVESRIGLLTVHIEPSRAFDAEVYLDEAGVVWKPEHKVDQRLNLGKWVLRNLLDPFVREQLRRQQKRERSSSTATSGAASVHSISSVEELSMSLPRSAGAISRPAPSMSGNVQETYSLAPMPTFGQNQSSGFSTALATPAMTPAVLPDVSDLAAQLASPRLALPPLPLASSLATIPQSPAAAAAATAPATPVALATKRDGDYFSARPKTAGDTQSMTSDGQAVSTPRQGVLAPNTVPGVSSIPVSASKPSKMSRFKSFAKKDSTPKKEAEAIPSDPVAATEGDEGASQKEVPQILDAEQAQSALLAALLTHQLQPPPWNETPSISFGADVPVMVGEETRDAGAWATVFRSTVTHMPAEMANLEKYIPPWVLEFICHNVIPYKEQVKIAFILEPDGGADSAGLPELPSGNARLSATRMLRMRKACHYVAEKLELESWRQRQTFQAATEGRSPSLQGSSSAYSPAGLPRSNTKTSLSSIGSYPHLQNPAGQAGAEEPTVLPEDEVEILCKGEIVPLNITLAACAKYSFGKGGDVYLTYRRRAARA